MPDYTISSACSCGPTRRCWVCSPSMFPNAYLALGITREEMQRQQSEVGRCEDCNKVILGGGWCGPCWSKRKKKSA